MASAPGKGRRQGRDRCGGACPGEERAGAEPWSWPQNIHLVARWLSTLDKKLERHSAGSHDDYRVFISAEPAPSPESHIIPQGILENAIKITNEPPTGMYANLHKALDLFTQVGPLLCFSPTLFPTGTPRQMSAPDLAFWPQACRPHRALGLRVVLASLSRGGGHCLASRSLSAQSHLLSKDQLKSHLPREN